jgi:hypothetical protein
MNRILALVLLSSASVCDAAFFLSTNGMMQLLPDFEAYQEKREIRYMAKFSQFLGYVTGIVDGTDGTVFCLPGAVDAEQAAGVVARYLREHPEGLPRKASETVSAALASRYPCRK